MNERFKELENLAVFYNKEDDTWEFDREKFAELLVLECARKTKEFVRAISTKGDAESSEDLLKQHFGVEQ